MNVTEAIIHKLAWKTPVIDRYATGLLKAALRLQDNGIVYFNNDDVAEAYQPGDGTTVGTVFKLMMMEHVIQPFYSNIPSLAIYGGMRRSTRSCNNGHRNQLYQLNSTSIAVEWLERHCVEVEDHQLTLSI